MASRYRHLLSESFAFGKKEEFMKIHFWKSSRIWLVIHSYSITLWFDHVIITWLLFAEPQKKGVNPGASSSTSEFKVISLWYHPLNYDNIILCILMYLYLYNVCMYISHSLAFLAWRFTHWIAKVWRRDEDQIKCIITC